MLTDLPECTEGPQFENPGPQYKAQSSRPLSPLTSLDGGGAAGYFVM